MKSTQMKPWGGNVKAVLVTTLLMVGGVFFAVQSNSKPMSTPEASIKKETIEGFLLEKPKYHAKSKQWVLRIAAKKHKVYGGKAVTLTLPRSDAHKVSKYYLGDYVKIANVTRVDSLENSETLASEAAN